jgi:CubicO group peptidase (beta-lactamase class C family)
MDLGKVTHPYVAAPRAPGNGRDTIEGGRRMKISILALGALLATPCLARADTAADRQRAVENGLLPAVVVEGGAGARRLVDEMRALKTPGAAIAVVRGGKVDWVQGYGVTSPGGGAVDADTLFQAGSVSKPVAAAVMMSLVQDGTLSLDAPINTVLKGWALPENDFTRTAPVTLRRLLSHSAGTTVHGFAGQQQGRPSRPAGRDQLPLFRRRLHHRPTGRGRHRQGALSRHRPPEAPGAAGHDPQHLRPALARRDVQRRPAP